MWEVILTLNSHAKKKKKKKGLCLKVKQLVFEKFLSKKKNKNLKNKSNYKKINK